MKGNDRFGFRTLWMACVVLAAMASIGCQVDVGGQTLPSPHYLTDDIQFFPAGPEFPLSNEAAVLRERRGQENE